MMPVDGSVGESGESPAFPTFPVGRLVQVSSGNPQRYLVLDDTDQLPDDSCIELLEE
jgi:hypothetical protein